MAILPVYTTFKLHAARINLKHLAQHRVIVRLRKRAWFWPEVGVVCKNFRPTLRTPLHEILDPPLICWRTLLSPSKGIGGPSYCSHLYSCGDSLVVLFPAKLVVYKATKGNAHKRLSSSCLKVLFSQRFIYSSCHIVARMPFFSRMGHCETGEPCFFFFFFLTQIRYVQTLEIAIVS